MNFPLNAETRMMRRILDAFGIAIVVIVIGSFSRGARISPIPFGAPMETITWYCAGDAVLHGADPYRVEPLRSCEVAHHAIRAPQWVEPAPLPGYVLAFFSLFARLPFSVVQTGLLYALTAAVVGTAFLLARIVRISPLVTFLCLAPLDGYLNLLYRELPPLAVLALVAAGMLGSAGRFRAAAGCAAAAMLEPHVGLPGALAVFVWWPRTRVPLAMFGAALAAISVITLGTAANIEYFTAVLPAHAAAEIAAADQYSLTRVLHVLGLTDAAALRLGGASYLVMTGLGVFFARGLANATRKESLVPLFPPAVAMLGGAFVHDIQIAAAIPAAIIIAAWERPPAPLRAVALVPIVFTWQVWYWERSVQVFPLEIGAVTAAVLLVARYESVRVRCTAAVLGAVFCSVLALAIAHLPRIPVGPPSRPAPPAAGASDLASANWAASVSRDATYSTPHLVDLAEKLPVWIGLATLTGIGIVYARRKPIAREEIAVMARDRRRVIRSDTDRAPDTARVR